MTECTHYIKCGRWQDKCFGGSVHLFTLSAPGHINIEQLGTVLSYQPHSVQVCSVQISKQIRNNVRVFT